MSTVHADTPPGTPQLRPAVVYRPESAVFWVFAAALLIGSLGTAVVLGQAFVESFDAQLWLTPLWVLAYAVLIWIIFKFDPFRATRRYRQALFAAAALGGTAAMAMTYAANLTYDDVLLRVVSPTTLDSWSSSLRAPVIEEASKAMCAALILILCASVFHRISHALMVGMFVGLGFELVEDLHFAGSAAINGLDGDASAISNSLITRMAAGLPSHWSYTALTAVAVLLLLPTFSETSRWGRARRLGTAVTLATLAWGMHFWFDMPLTPPTWTGAIIWLAKFPVCALLFLVTVWLLIKDERRVVTERIVGGREDLPLSTIGADVLESLPTYPRRRRFRRHAKREGGRAAKKNAAVRQAHALDLIQSIP